VITRAAMLVVFRKENKINSNTKNMEIPVLLVQAQFRGSRTPNNIRSVSTTEAADRRHKVIKIT